MRIAMWSGPRNLSTAMMYSFGNRADCSVMDEPFYAAYLKATGLEHPMRDAILASQPTDPAQVANRLVSNKSEKAHFYQKHMCQHMVPDMPREWMRDVKNVFLIRHPARVVASFSAKYENPTAADLGLELQANLFDEVRTFDPDPIVIDSADIRRDPEHLLKRLCNALGLEFDTAMLRWPLGGHADDGIWAKHWYGAVHRSTGFAGPEPTLPKLDGRAAELSAEALPFYDRLAEFKLT